SSRSSRHPDSLRVGAGRSATLARTINRDYHERTVTTLLRTSIHAYRNPPVVGRNFIASRHTEGGPLAANMEQTKHSGVGFLKATKARHAEEAIGQSEGLVTVLRLTQADLKPAEDTIRIAKHLFDAHQYAKAFHQAKRAESLALSLDERFNGYTKAAKALRSRIDAMRHLGLTTEALDGVVRRAEEKILAGAWDNGT